jgi:pyridinium-3,5-bisthiocarboxylic acid mononucleotide nickel chelatase
MDGTPEATAGGARNVAWFHCFAGIAGDMALGSLLDAGAELEEVRGLLDRLPIGGWRLDVEPVLRGGVAASRAEVTVTDNVVVRTYSHIVGLVAEARLPPRVTKRALATFAALAEVEARLHRRPVGHVHFHEVGGHDAVIDVVGTAAALEVLAIDEVRASPVATGTGMVRTAHGLLPNPTPAVVDLLEGVPLWGRNLPVELTTPTGAALLAALSSGYGPMPAMRITGQGFGAGSRDIDELPNCTQVVLGVAVDRRVDLFSAPTKVVARGGTGGDSEASAGSEDDGHPGGLLHGDADADAGQPVVLIETNVDDATGEQLAHAATALLESGALDVWITPVIMKKGRPGSVVHVLAEASRAGALRSLLRRTTGSLGVRATRGERWPASRSLESVSVDGQLIRIKVSPAGVKAEHDDVAAAARRTGRSLRDLARRAESEWLAAGHPLPESPVIDSTFPSSDGPADGDEPDPA